MILIINAGVSYSNPKGSFRAQKRQPIWKALSYSRVPDWLPTCICSLETFRSASSQSPFVEVNGPIP